MNGWMDGPDFSNSNIRSTRFVRPHEVISIMHFIFWLLVDVEELFGGNLLLFVINTVWG